MKRLLTFFALCAVFAGVHQVLQATAKSGYDRLAVEEGGECNPEAPEGGGDAAE